MKDTIKKHMNSNQALGDLAIQLANQHVYNEESDRQYFDRKHDHTGAGKREKVYQILADYEHNELPIDKFISDHIVDDSEALNRLIVSCLQREFSDRHPSVSDIGEELIKLVQYAFTDYVSGEDYE